MVAAPASAVPRVSGSFSVPGLTIDSQITEGPDGNMWVTTPEAPDDTDVARITTAGQVTKINLDDVDDPVGVVHVGDLRRTDVAGARALGMATVRFRGVVEDDVPEEGDDDGPEADHVIDRLAELPALLGVAGG